MKKILIFGANSYIARNMIFFLKENMNNSIQYSLYDNAKSHIDSDVNYKQINILDSNEVDNINLHCDAIYMFIGKTGSLNGFDDYETFIDVNEKALLSVLNGCRKQNTHAKIIFPSTRLVYKGSSYKLTEESEKEFKSVYAINKYSCEKYLELYNKVYGLQYCIFRICVPYGTLIPNASSYGTAEFMLSKAKNNEDICLYGDGHLKRTLIYIGDLCNVLVSAGLSSNCINDVYNIGGEEYSLREMADLISKKYCIHVRNVEWPEIALKMESGNTVFDDTKLRSSVNNICYKKHFSDWCEQE